MATKKSKHTKSQGPFPVAEDDTSHTAEGSDTSHEGLQTSGSIETPEEMKQDDLNKQLASVEAELKWRTEAMEHMNQQDANTYYQNNVKRLEDEVRSLKEAGAVEDTEAANKAKKDEADKMKTQAEQLQAQADKLNADAEKLMAETEDVTSHGEEEVKDEEAEEKY